MTRFDPSPWRQDAETWDQYVIRAGHYSVFGICACCMIIVANGESCGEDDCTTCAEDGGYARFFTTHSGHVSLGAFTDACGHDLSDNDQAEEHASGCERYGFCRYSCDLCGDPLHGDRYAAVYWPTREEIDTADANDMIDKTGASWE